MANVFSRLANSIFGPTVIVRETEVFPTVPSSTLPPEWEDAFKERVPMIPPTFFERLDRNKRR